MSDVIVLGLSGSRCATLNGIRQFLAQETGRFHGGLATAGSSVSSLEDTAWPITSSTAGSKAWQDYWLLRPGAGASDRVRRVATYTPDAARGTLQPDRNWTAAPAHGEPYELHGFFEPATAVPSLINDALKLCMIPTEFSFTPTALHTRHDLTALQPWLIDPVWVRSVGVLGAGNRDRDRWDPFQVGGVRGDATTDGCGHVCIRHGTFAATDVVYVLALKPAYSHCRAAGGTFGDQNGLVTDTDEVPVEVEWAAFGALVEGWRRYGQVLSQEGSAGVLASRQQAVLGFDRWDPRWKDRLPQTFTRIRHWGPVR